MNRCIIALISIILATVFSWVFFIISGVYYDLHVVNSELSIEYRYTPDIMYWLCSNSEVIKYFPPIVWGMYYIVFMLKSGSDYIQYEYLKVLSMLNLLILITLIVAYCSQHAVQLMLLKESPFSLMEKTAEHIFYLVLILSISATVYALWRSKFSNYENNKEAMRNPDSKWFDAFLGTGKL